MAICLLITLFIVGIALTVLDSKKIGFVCIIGICLSVISGIALFCIPIFYLNAKSEVTDYKNYKIYIQQVPRNKIENAGLTRDIIDYNIWLKSNQKWNKNSFLDYCIPDEVNKLKPIEINSK